MFNIELLQNIFKSKNKKINSIKISEFKVENILNKKINSIKIPEFKALLIPSSLNQKIIEYVNNNNHVDSYLWQKHDQYNNANFSHFNHVDSYLWQKHDIELKKSFLEMQNEIIKQEELNKHQHEILKQEILNRKKEYDILTSKMEVAEKFIENEKRKIIVIFNEKYNFGGDSAEYLSNKIVNYAYNKELDNLKQEWTKSKQKFEPYKNWFQEQQQNLNYEISNQPSTSKEGAYHL